MNGTQIKASRRELRKAFGPEAVQVIQQHDADLRLLTVNHNAAQQARIALADAPNARLDDHAAKLLALNEFRSAGWRARLRWLVRGR